MYAYEPLKTPSSFRVIELRPATTSNIVQCRLREANVASPPSYEALSYVWGDENDKTTILCDSCQLCVTSSLASALRQFSPADTAPSAYRVLWADGICINQGDIPEKESQVRIMGKIYEQADKVLIWLGEASEEDDCEAAWTCMKTLVNQVIPRMDELENWKIRQMPLAEIKASFTGDKRSQAQLATNGADIGKLFGIPPPDAPAYEAIARLLRRPWFTRAWTFQESLLARDRVFYCGTYSVTSRGFAQAIRVLLGLSLRTSDPRYLSRDILCAVMGRFEGRETLTRMGRITMLELLDMRRGAKCKYPSDLLYSLLGCVQDTCGVCVSYKTPFEQTFAAFMAHTIQAAGNLHALSLVDTHDNRPPTTALRSWAVDWRRKDTHRHFTGLTPGLYACSGSSKPLLRFSQDFREMLLQGVEYDAVADVKRGSDDVSAWLAQHVLDADNVYPPTGEDADTILTRARCLDRTLFDALNPNRRWGLDAVTRINSLAEAAGGEYTSFLLAMIDNVKDCNFIVTENARVGMASASVQRGDRVCIMPGGEVPLILRRCGDELKSRYTFLGECYIHGFMDGEGLVELRKHADPSYDGVDMSWLSHLHEQPCPYDMTEFCIV